MTTKRKISWRKILQMLLTITVATCCIVAMVSASDIESELPLKTMPLVHIKNDRKYHFIEQNEIMNLAIYDRKVDIVHTPVGKLDIRGIEEAIKGDKWVQDAQVYVNIDRVMHIYVTQRVPVARIFGQNGGSYYIDTTLHTMPRSKSYTYYTQIVTNVPEMNDDSAGMALRGQVVSLIRCLQANKFWSAQVSHIVMKSPGMFELIPVLGNQKIVFGDTSFAQEKLDNLTTFYNKVLNRIGWDKYETLDVRFRNQVIASPSLPFDGPVDKASLQMNWIKSIEETVGIKVQSSHRSPKAKAIVARKPAVAEKAKPKSETHANTKKAASADNRSKNSNQVKKGKKPSKQGVKSKSKENKPKYIYQENNQH